MTFTVRRMTAEEAFLLGRRVGMLWRLLELWGQWDKRQDSHNDGG